MVQSHVLDRFAPAFVVVNREGNVVFYSNRTGKYLESPSGPPSQQILAVARKGLRLDIRSALQETVENRATARRERVAVEFEDRVQLVDITIEPVGENTNDPLFIIMFADVGSAMDAEESLHGGARGDADEVVAQLERELRETRERLQSVIEEYETALEELKSTNEELVSVNEELQSTNEELETSKEEMHSVNEELHHVNLALNTKVDELDRANGDLQNLFDSTEIAALFLDRKLVIRNFTPTVAKLFKLIPADCGRLLTDFAINLEPNLIREDVQTALDTGRAVKRNVSRDDGRQHFLIRTVPYLSGRGAPEEVLVTLVDVTDLINAEHQRTLIEELNHRVKNMLTVVIALARQTFAHADDGAATLIRAFVGRIEGLSRSYDLISRVSWGDVSLDNIVRESVQAHSPPERFSISGSPILLKPKAALALGLILHELATNAVKYGSLSGDAGQVAINWQVEGLDGKRQLALFWQELGRAGVAKKAADGFGTKLIRREVEYELNGDVTLDYAEHGLSAIMRIPLNKMLVNTAGNGGGM